MEYITNAITANPSYILLFILISSITFLLAKNMSLTISMDFKRYKFKIRLNKKTK